MHRTLPPNLLFWLLLSLLLPASAFAQPRQAAPRPALVDCQIRVAPGEVECLDDALDVQWSVLHDSQTESVEPRPIGPIEARRQTYYAVGSDLLRVNNEPDVPGIIAERLRFPGRITDLEVDDTHIVVHVHHRFSDVQFRYAPGQPAPAQLFWNAQDLSYQRNTHQDAFLLFHDTPPAAALTSLRPARYADPTNPFIPFYIGQAYEGIDADAAARTAYRQAVDTRGALWQDLVFLSTKLDEIGHHDLAAEAFEEAMERLPEDLNLDRLSSVFIAAIALHQDTLDRLLDDGDARQAHELALRAHRLSPRGEGLHTDWLRLADWLDDQDLSSVGDFWRAAASEAELGFFNRALYHTTPFGWWLLLFWSTLLAAFAMALVAGLRAGRPRPDAPRTLRVDLVAIAALLAIALASPLIFTYHLTVVGLATEAPMGLETDTLTDPEIATWLESLAPSEARDELLDIVATESEALLSGRRAPDRPSLDDLLTTAIHAEASHRRATLVGSPEIPRLSLSGGSLLRPHRTGFLHLLGIIALLAALFFAGRALSTHRPTWAIRLLHVLPGGPTSLATLTAFLLVLSIAAFLGLLGVHHLLTTAATSTSLHGLPAEEPTPGLWIWIALIIAVILQNLGIWRDAKLQS